MLKMIKEIINHHFFYKEYSTRTRKMELRIWQL